MKRKRKRVDTPEQRQDQNRASRIRAKVRARQPLSEIETAWLKRYEAEVRERWHPKKQPQSPAAAVVAAVCARYGLSREVLVGPSRGGLAAELARAVAVMTLRELGGSLSVIGKAVGRGPPAIHHIVHRAANDGRQVLMAREVDAILEVCDPRAAAVRAMRRGQRVGAVVTMTVTVDVGSSLWVELDRIAEYRERSEDAIAHRSRREPLAGVE